ncbi:glutathione S-transferase T3-like protein [Tanacetum coccineum]
MYHPHRASPPPTQSSSIPTFNLDDDNFEPLWASASQPSQHTKGPSKPVEDDSPVEEVAVVRASENNVEGNGKKAAGFWTKVTEYFHKKIGEHKRSYDSVNCKWKNRIRPKVSQFCEIYNSVKDRHQSGACDNTIYQEAKIEYRTIYHSAFALTECWKILKDHSKWRKVEMPTFFNSKKTSSKKSRTSETTSQGNSDSAHIGVDLNDEATDSEDVEVQEVRPMGRDAAKKKRSSSGAHSESSVAGDHGLVDALVSKFTMAARLFFSLRKESSFEYLRIKERKLELEDQRRREQG